MDQIHVTLPDGSVKEFPKGVTPVEIAKSISPRLAEAGWSSAAVRNAEGISASLPAGKLAVDEHGMLYVGLAILSAFPHAS